MLIAAVDWSNVATEAVQVLGIVIGAFLVSRLLRWVIKRSMLRMLEPPAAGRLARLRERTPNALLRTTEEWSLRTEARVQTLTAVFRSLASLAVWFVALWWILEVLNVNWGPLVASAGIIGVALGFGAQNIVRDFLGGFFLVVEDQFGVGDIVDLGPDAKGTVEKITLRSTRLRDVNGTVWHVPNGQIMRVGNKSQEWARALLDLELDIDADYEVAQETIQRVADSMAADPAWRHEILGPPEVWGIETFTAGGFVVRLVVKTRPASQFSVMRELRIRLKPAFAEAGLRFPDEHPELWLHEADRGAAPTRRPEPHRESPAVERTPSGMHPIRGDASEA